MAILSKFVRKHCFQYCCKLILPFLFRRFGLCLIVGIDLRNRLEFYEILFSATKDWEILMILSVERNLYQDYLNPRMVTLDVPRYYLPIGPSYNWSSTNPYHIIIALS